jgi:hypothetical protein
MNQASTTAVGAPQWQSRVQNVLSRGLANETARQKAESYRRQREAEAFADLTRRFSEVVRPVLQCTVETLRRSGVEAWTHESIHEEPRGLPRSVEMTLRVAHVGTTGPATLAIVGVEGSASVRARLVVEPGQIGGDFVECEASQPTGELSEDDVGTLVAQLLEMIFSDSDRSAPANTADGL